MASFLQFVSIIVFTLGAPAFSILALSYLRQRKRSSTLFRIFTVICAFAFLDNLAAVAFVINSPILNIMRALLLGILPPMMANLVLQQEPGPGPRRLWQALQCLLYAAAIVSALGGSALGIQRSWSRFSENSSQIMVAAVSVFSLTLLLFTSRDRNRVERRQRSWNLVLFLALLFAAIAAFISDNPFFALVPDYVLLLFFAVRLYYTERFAFFDTFVKGGSYFAVGAMLLALSVLTIPPFANIFSTDWIHASLAILVLMPVWIVGPFLYERVGRWTDRALHRKYSAIEAERLFMQAAQSGMSEEQLRSVAALSLGEIFGCRAEIDFRVDSKDQLLTARAEDLARPLAPRGRIRLMARDSEIPFLSADRRLLDTLAATLGVLLQNARLRAEQARQLLREQELAALASRAELRALRAQINPHFLFNALNAIAGWIRTEPEFADETVAQLAEVFRYTLQRSQTEWVQVREEVDFIRAYLAVERARFRDRLEIEIEVDPAANSLRIPAMMIQPIVENAIKHGTSQAPAKGRIVIAIRREGLTIRVEVTDNGPGFPPAFTLDNTASGHALGHGLWNVAERLKGYYSGRGSLRWENNSKGNCVTLELCVGEES